MIKFDDLVGRLADRRFAGGRDQFMRCDGDDNEKDIDLDAVAMALIQELGLHVGANGRVRARNGQRRRR